MTVVPLSLRRCPPLPSLQLAAREHASLAAVHEMLAYGERLGVPASSLLLSLLARQRPVLVARARRTAEWSLMLGQATGRDDTGQEAHDVALLADVGHLALAVPDEGESWTEWRVRRASHDVLAGVSTLASVAPGVLTVAESFDGRGLPIGLSGDEIPLAARIVRLTRAFDAASGGWWPGVAGPAVARACAQLVHDAGTTLDPALVHVWLRLLDRHLSEGAA